jgi:hypothetical protein
MKSNNLISVRSNCNFALNYETGKLHPQTEVILITTAPKYVINKKKDSYTKETDITEYRFLSGLEGINVLWLCEGKIFRERLTGLCTAA